MKRGLAVSFRQIEALTRPIRTSATGLGLAMMGTS